MDSNDVSWIILGLGGSGTLIYLVNDCVHARRRYRSKLGRMENVLRQELIGTNPRDDGDKYKEIYRAVEDIRKHKGSLFPRNELASEMEGICDKYGLMG